MAISEITRRPLLRYPNTALVLPPAYCGSVERYAAMSMFDSVVIDTSRRHDKRLKECHRCTIEGANGVQRLTVPLVKPTEWHSTRLADLQVSRHGEWWEVHWGAIFSAYGRSPFFEYYADRLKPAFTGEIESLVELDAMIDAFCCRALGLEFSPVGPDARIVNEMPRVNVVPYYQVWAERFGFTRGLSVLDLIFNMGPEAPLVLRRMTLAATPL